MSDVKHHDIEHLERSSNSGGGQQNLTTITLTPEQFESMYLQPRNPRMNEDLSRRLGNPTPLGVSAFLLAVMPLAMDLLNFQGTTAVSSIVILGAFYACAGIGLYLACIMEWIMGNTFPSVVFGTFGGFWISFAILIQPNMALAASFAPPTDATNGATAAAAGAATRQYNSGLAMYLIVWGILSLIFFIASLRTNVPFAIVFFALLFVLGFLAAGYIHTGQGITAAAAQEFKIAGGFAFLTSLAAIWIDVSLLLASVQFPMQVPMIDLSGYGFLKRKHRKEHIA